jgi:alpha-1,6-mannosyltransferase
VEPSTPSAIAPIDSAVAAPPLARPPGAPLAVLDITKYFGATSGGIKTYLVEKARYVGTHPNLRQILVLPAERTRTIDGDGVRWYWVRGPAIPGQAPYRLLLAWSRLAEIVTRERPDVIEVGSPFLVPWLARHAAGPSRTPLVWFYHSHLPRVVCPDFDRAGALRRASARAAWGYVRRLSHLFARILVTSDYVARDLEAAGISRVERVPLGVDLELFHPRRRERRTETRTQFGLPDGPLGLFVGRLAREKQLEVLLDAWPEVERRSGAHLAIVGVGPAAAAYRRRVGAAWLTWIPYVSDRADLADLYAAADLYLSPSSLETFGLAALEAMASGTPVLSADRGGVAERVLASGGGAVFPSGHAPELADAAVALLGSAPGVPGAAGRAYAERNHAWDRVFDRLFEVYAQVLASAPARE